LNTATKTKTASTSVPPEMERKTFVGEAFNIAPSFFNTKKTSMLKKLRDASASYKIIYVQP
jgi:hypothetical protein